MGLDMYAYKTKELIDQPVDFTVDDDKVIEIQYWRKHPNLHGWMERLYRERGGQEQSFNTTNLALTPEDLTRLEEAIELEELPDTQGFFFGVSRPEDKMQDREFIKEAREAISNGYTVFYTSWW